MPFELRLLLAKKPDELSALGRIFIEGIFRFHRELRARLLKRVYNIDALRCACGGEIRFEELIDSPEKARAFLDLHEIESPRPSSSQKHIQTWSDAPNIALAWGRVDIPNEAAQGSSTTASASSHQSLATRMSGGVSHPTRSDEFHDALPLDEFYFVDVVPPD